MMKNKRPAVGFISPPAWFDPAPAEFPRVCVAGFTLRPQVLEDYWPAAHPETVSQIMRRTCQ